MINRNLDSDSMNRRNLYAITGITGKIGGVLARTLLAANQPVRAVARDADKGAVWAAQGSEVALAEMHDESALTAAFELVHFTTKGARLGRTDSGTPNQFRLARI